MRWMYLQLDVRFDYTLGFDAYIVAQLACSSQAFNVTSHMVGPPLDRIDFRCGGHFDGVST